MGALDGFLATWSRAHDTFGSGEPERGEQFDQSSVRLAELQAAIQGAGPGDQWSGSAATAYEKANADHARTVGDLADLDRQVSAYVTRSAQLVTAGRHLLDDIKSWTLAAADAVLAGPHREQTLMAIASAGTTRVRETVEEFSVQFEFLAGALRALDDEYTQLGNGARVPRPQHVQAVDFVQSPPGIAEDLADRPQNEAAAFRELFGREPSSTIDWQTAAVLDPHSYHPDTDGLASEIRVVRIEPVPGQGLVRAGQYIEQRDVISGPWKRDFGNGRATDPKFDPADTKVTTYIDYENGLVVMRQNPSVELAADGGPGQVRVGIPDAVVLQNSDGAVRIQYDAANPFAPGIAQDPPWPLQDNPWTVNGDLVFTPTADGIRVDGTRTNYPSLEVYQDLPDGSSRTVLIDPAIAGNSTGPMLNLPQHHDIGTGGDAFAPFDTGGWNPKYDVRIPLPSTAAGPTTSPPSVPLTPSLPGVTQI
ncbi:EspA/EspE family type VII secretion system effector [Mycolicibacterium vaccae]|uniref:EspA/EspE family type VII secretion system effector n=1 Tax=Mycolicibacterium vaccae TaxID=1810 RepID=UPI003CEA8B2F